ncbi:MAG: RNA methyltransferase, partial [Leadbetterella sp.]|nr:RNA methyltransferase [Leadbetterella sp.]
LKAYKPEISGLIAFEDFMKESGAFSGKFIAHLDEAAEDIMEVVLPEKVLLLIGPEGDFSKEELQMATENGFKTLTLGKSRLRTETAGVFAVSILNARKVGSSE